MPRDFFEWAAEFGAATRPWLLLGKGPSFGRRGEFPLERFWTCGLNHVVREMPLTLAHFLDMEALVDAAPVLDHNTRFCVVPWFPHIGFLQTRRALPELVADVPALAALDRAGRLLTYRLNDRRARTKAPRIRSTYFSSEAALALLAAAGAGEVRSLGIDGGTIYANAFEDLRERTLLASGHASFDLQFAGMAETIYRSGVFYAPLWIDAPIRVVIVGDERREIPARVLEHAIRRQASMSVEVIRVPPARASAARPPILRAWPDPSARERALELDAAMLVCDDLASLWTLTSRNPTAPIPGRWQARPPDEAGDASVLDFTRLSRPPWLARAEGGAKVWYAALRAARADGFVDEKMISEAIARGHVSPELRRWARWARASAGLIARRERAAQGAVGWKVADGARGATGDRLRVAEPVRELVRRGFRIERYARSKEASYRAVVFSAIRDLAEREGVLHLEQGRTKVFLDLRPAELEDPANRSDWRKVVAAADVVVCSSQGLADHVFGVVGLAERPEVIAEPIDPLVTLARRERAEDEPRRVLWLGDASSDDSEVGDLLSIREALEEVAAEIPFELRVVSDRPESVATHLARFRLPTSSVAWRADTFGRVLASADAVILPLRPTPSNRLRSASRLVTALAAGVPVIADPIPSHQEFAGFALQGDWRRGLREALSPGAELTERTRAGQEYVWSHFTTERIADRWRDVFVRHGVWDAARRSWVRRTTGAIKRMSGTAYTLATQRLLGTFR